MRRPLGETEGDRKSWRVIRATVAVATSTFHPSRLVPPRDDVVAAMPLRVAKKMVRGIGGPGRRDAELRQPAPRAAVALHHENAAYLARGAEGNPLRPSGEKAGSRSSLCKLFVRLTACSSPMRRMKMSAGSCSSLWFSDLTVRGQSVGEVSVAPLDAIFLTSPARRGRGPRQSETRALTIAMNTTPRAQAHDHDDERRTHAARPGRRRIGVS